MKLFQTNCVLCQLNQVSKLGFCDACYTELPWVQTGCVICALPLKSTDQHTCGKCIKNKPVFEKIITPFYYQSPLSSLIKAYKFQERIHLGRIFANLMQEQLQHHYQHHPWPELILPVPLHNSRLHERGYNQSIILATKLSRALHIPMQRHTLKRIRATKAQHSINQGSRIRNVKNAFAMNRKLSVNHVALIDDVVTTGATVNALSKTLLNAGIKQIDIWSIARTP